MISPVKLWRRQKKVSSLLGKTGKIMSYTYIRVAPRDYINQAPYPVVIVELTDKTRMIGQLVDCHEDDLKIGREVSIVLRRARIESHEDIIPYTLKFKPS